MFQRHVVVRMLVRESPADPDALQAAALTRKSWVSYRSFSLYSLVTALATFLALPTVIPEARAAWREIK